MTLSPFNVAQSVGNNVAGGFQRAQDTSSIDRIISDAMESGDPQVFQNSIGKILSQVSPDRQPDAIKFLEGQVQQIGKKKQEQQQRTALQQVGVDPNLPPNLQAEQYKNQYPKAPAGGLNGKLGSEYNKIREKDVADYVSSAIKEGEDAELTKFSLSTARQAVNGDITGPGYMALAKNNPYGQLLLGLTPDEAILQAANKNLLAGTKSIFGSKPTEREIFLLLNSMLPSMGKTREANLAGLDFIDKVTEMKIAKAQIINELTNGGVDFVPNLQTKAAEMMQPYAEKLLDELRIASEQFGTKDNKKNDDKTIRVKAPDGTEWKMTQKQIDAAKEKDVIFEPIK